MHRMKARLRAWLIDLVREAIRVERLKEQGVYDAEFLARHPFLEKLRPVAPIRTAEQLIAAVNETEPIVLEPSFEQMQADAIAEQRKFYEPKRA